jgi:UDP-glucose 4-epimerase
VSKSLDLAEHLVRNGCRRLVYSSSAAIYAPTATARVDESSPIAPVSPYARTKAMVEELLADIAIAHDLRIISLRYFNPIGADPKMRTGLQLAEPSHALGKLIEAYHNGRPFRITGVDWPTRDGSGIRDYVHVWDLAEGHVRAITEFDRVGSAAGFEAINLGTGQGTTVRELVAGFEDVVGEPLVVQEAPRRPGDVLGCYAATDKARAVLGWQSRLSLAEGIRHAIDWRTHWLGTRTSIR